MRSKIYSSDHVKTTSKGQTWIPVLLALGFLMAFPVAELLMLGNWHGVEYTEQQIAVLYDNLWKDGLLNTGFVIVTIAAVINGINNFWYLYSGRKTDFYHSLPVKRSWIFVHKTYVGILYYLIPYAVMEFLAVCIGAMWGLFSLHLMGRAAAMLAIHLILYLMIYFSVVLVVCLTGNILMGALTLAGMFLYSMVLETLLAFYRQFFFATAYLNSRYGLLKFLGEYASPYLLGEKFLEVYRKGNVLPMLAVVILTTVILAALAYTAYQKRPSESAGRPMIYGWVGIAVKFMVVVPCGLGAGLIFYMLPSGSGRMIWWIFGMIFGTILSHGVIEIVYQMDFRKFFTKRVHLAAAGVLVAVAAVSYQKDLLGFDAYLPAQNKLESLNVDLGNLGSENYYYIKEGADGTYQSSYVWSDIEAAFTDEKGIGDETYQVLEKMVKKQEKPRSTRIFSDGAKYSSSSGWSYYIAFKYTLKSGKEVYRKYLLTSEDIRALLGALYREGDLKEKKYSFLSLKDEYLNNMDAIFKSGESYSIFQDQPEKRTELFEAFRADVEDADIEELLEQPCAQLQFDFKIPAEASADNMVPHLSEYWSHVYQGMFVYPSFERTIAILKETGYPLSIDEVDPDSIEITYMDSEIGKEGEYDSETVVYDGKKELDALKPLLIPSLLRCPWKNYVNGIDAVMTSDGNLNSVYMFLLAEEVPDFVLEKIEEHRGNGAMLVEDSVYAEDEYIEDGI